MACKVLDSNTALVTGGTGDIGYAISEYFISLNEKVFIAGRTKSKLKDAAAKLGRERSNIAPFMKVTSEHPSVDCIVKNARVQRPLDVNEMTPDEFLEKRIRKSPSIINPIYNGKKALVFRSINLQTHLPQAGGSVRAVAIAPPTVCTGLHREWKDPNDNKEKNSAAFSVEEFMENITSRWREDRDVVSAGMGQQVADRWYGEFGNGYGKAAGGLVNEASLHDTN